MATRRTGAPHLQVQDSYGRLCDLCDVHGWRVEIALGQPRPDLSDNGLELRDLELQVHIPGSPPTFAVHSPVEDPIYYAAAIALEQIRDR